MIDADNSRRMPVRSDRLRWEIGAALLIKLILLVGLWFLIFRWQDKPAGQPDIAERFALQAAQGEILPGFSSQPLEESHHVR